MNVDDVCSAIFDGVLSEDALVAHLENRERWVQGVDRGQVSRLDTLMDLLESDVGRGDRIEALRKQPQALAACFAFAPPAQMVRLVYACEQHDTDLLPGAIDASHGRAASVATWRYAYLRALTTMCRLLQHRHQAPAITLSFR